MSESSGPQWVERFPTSTALGDLAPSFRDKAGRFVLALRAAGATVTINATFRPPQRAYLMHWCCMIADAKQDPARILPMPGVDIDWAHGGDLVAAHAAARAMKAAYGIAYPAALQSRHTQGLAIDMSIFWDGSIQVEMEDGRYCDIENDDADLLHKVGASYGVIKLVTDPPHWSSDGR